MNNYISELIDEIAIVESESTISVIESMMDVYDKAELIEEYVSSDPEYDGYFQEGVIDNVKMKGMTDSNKFVTAIKFIPRLIKELIKQLATKLKRHPEGLSKKEVENVHAKVEKCLVDAKYREKLNTALKAIGVTVGLVGAGTLVFTGIKQNKEKNTIKSSVNTGGAKTRLDEIMQITKDAKTGKIYLTTLDLDKLASIVEKFEADKTRSVNKWDSLSKKLEEFLMKGRVNKKYELPVNQEYSLSPLFKKAHIVSSYIPKLMGDIEDEQTMTKSEHIQGDRTFKTFNAVAAYINENKKYMYDIGYEFSNAKDLTVTNNGDDVITITNPSGASVSLKEVKFAMNSISGITGERFVLSKKPMSVGKKNCWQLTRYDGESKKNMKLSDKRSTSSSDIAMCYTRIYNTLSQVNRVTDTILWLVKQDEATLFETKTEGSEETPKVKNTDKEAKGDEE